MVVANVYPMPRFSLGCSVVSASSIRINRNSESLTNVSRTVKSLSRLIVSTHVNTQYAKRFLKTLRFLR